MPTFPSELRIRCQDLFVKFKAGSNQNTLRLSARDVGGTSYIEVFRTGDELTAWHVRSNKSAEFIVQQVVTWNWDTVFEYECQNITSGAAGA